MFSRVAAAKKPVRPRSSITVTSIGASSFQSPEPDKTDGDLLAVDSNHHSCFHWSTAPSRRATSLSRGLVQRGCRVKNVQESRACVRADLPSWQLARTVPAFFPARDGPRPGPYSVTAAVHNCALSGAARAARWRRRPVAPEFGTIGSRVPLPDAVVEAMVEGRMIPPVAVVSPKAVTDAGDDRSPREDRHRPRCLHGHDRSRAVSSARTPRRPALPHGAGRRGDKGASVTTLVEPSRYRVKSSASDEVFRTVEA
jgi:hypothetical protein